MDQESIIAHVAAHYPGTDIQCPTAADDVPAIAVGDTFFIYDPTPDADPDRPATGAHRFPFATIVTKDYGDFDNASNLDRPGVYRLNIGLSRQTYLAHFGPDLPKPGPDGVVQTGHDFTALDVLMPHPVYAPQWWVSVLNPSEATFRAIEPLLTEAYENAVRRHGHAQPDASW